MLIAATSADHRASHAVPPILDLATSVAVASAGVEPAVAAEPTSTATTFAAIDGVDLALPAAEVVGHGFHEAGGRGPLPLTPVGTLQAGEGTNGFDEADAVADGTGPDYFVLPTRDRGTGPTTAVDVVVEQGEDVLSPVDGVVTTVADYTLYGSHQDTLIHIRPHDAPHLEVKVLHVDGASIAAGDTVVAGETVIADTARRIPVTNQIDRFVGRELPHVHLEVIPATTTA